MAILIGTDEAGYGPNLGPLLITATAWHVPDTLLHGDLYESLADCVCRETSRENQSPRLAIADSKKLYSPATGMETLERNLLAALSGGQALRRWRQIWHHLAPDCAADRDQLPWYRDFDMDAPVAATDDDVAALSGIFSSGLKAQRVQFAAIHCVAVFPHRFNALLAEHETKGAMLSRLTLRLVARLLKQWPGEAALVVCDKHGGRNKYAALLMEDVADSLVEVRQESRAQSVYHWHEAARSVEFQFRTGGESFLPCALASMASKYLRELAMLAENRFWSAHVANLKPTAGYPTDAVRFKRDIAAAQAKLGIPDDFLWRQR